MCQYQTKQREQHEGVFVYHMSSVSTNEMQCCGKHRTLALIWCRDTCVIWQLLTALWHECTNLQNPEPNNYPSL